MSIKITKAQLQAIKHKVETQQGEVVAQIDAQLSARYMKDLNKVIKDAIRQFYGAYKPHYYGRTMSLLYMFELIPHGSDIEMNFGGEFAGESHSLSNEGIFDLSFMEGYHGGAKTGEGHPSPGTPYWKSHKSGYTEWSMPAFQSTPPIDLVDNAIDAYNGTLDSVKREIITPIVTNWLLG